MDRLRVACSGAHDLLPVVQDELDALEEQMQTIQRSKDLIMCPPPFPDRYSPTSSTSRCGHLRMGNRPRRPWHKYRPGEVRGGRRAGKPEN
jgi:hypothetical protein